jgi:hypothetical protein
MRRGIFAFLALVALLVVAIGVAIPFLAQSLPDPAKADRQQLLRWLIAKNLEQETPATRLTLAQRLESEFAAGIDWTAFQSKIQEPQRKQLLNNIPCVLRPWILEKAEAYMKLSEGQRTAFLDRLIDTLESWRGVEKILPQSTQNTQGTEKPPKLTAMLLKEMDSLQKEVPTEQQQQLNQLWTAMQARWLWRSFAPKI